MKLEFKAEDFPWKKIDLTCGINSQSKHAKVAKAVAKICNARLKEILDQAPVVYQATSEHDWSVFKPSSLAKNAHRARLVCIERMGGELT